MCGFENGPVITVSSSKQIDCATYKIMVRIF